MVSRKATTNPGSIVAPPANSSAVSSQSTRPSFRAMKPSRLAAMWIVTRESVRVIRFPLRLGAYASIVLRLATDCSDCGDYSNSGDYSDSGDDSNCGDYSNCGDDSNGGAYSNGGDYSNGG